MKLSWVHSTSRPVEPSRLESPRATWAKPVRRGITRWSVRVWCDPSGFIKSVPWCLPLLSPSVSLSCALHWGWSKSIWRGVTLPITTPCRQPDLVARTTVVNGSSFGGSSLTLFKGVGPRMGSPESYSGVWGILVHPSPPGWACLQPTSFIGRISPVYTSG